jgi:hypothetical protein
MSDTAFVPPNVLPPFKLRFAGLLKRSSPGAFCYCVGQPKIHRARLKRAECELVVCVNPSIGAMRFIILEPACRGRRTAEPGLMPGDRPLLDFPAESIVISGQTVVEFTA